MHLDNKDAVNSAYTRTLRKSIVRCRILDIRDSAGKSGSDGEPTWDYRWITYQLEQDAICTDGTTFAAGGTVEASIVTTDDTHDDPKAIERNRRSSALWRSLIVAGLGMPLSEASVMDKLEAAGGLDALKGRSVMVEWNPGKEGGNFVNGVSAVPG